VNIRERMATIDANLDDVQAGADACLRAANSLNADTVQFDGLLKAPVLRAVTQHLKDLLISAGTSASHCKNSDSQWLASVKNSRCRNVGRSGRRSRMQTPKRRDTRTNLCFELPASIHRHASPMMSR